MTQSTVSDLAPAQTLHGYADGHRLLAATPQIPDDVLHHLVRMTDLSGYLPSETTFDCYHSGFPTGPYYALCATWLDQSGRRGGTVLTHTLLLPADCVRAAQDPWRFSALHRKPAGVEDTAHYCQHLSTHNFEDGTPVQPSRQLVAAAFTQTGAILKVSERPDPTPVAQLWALLWPAARIQLRFCTFALQPLTDPNTQADTPFDVQILPPSARSAFHQFAGAAGWWPDNVAQRDMGMVDEVVSLGNHGLGALFASWPSLARRDHLAQLLRLEKLKAAAPQRLAAARACVDLLDALDPAGHHSDWDLGFTSLVEGQSEASRLPRPLWDLDDLLARPQLGSWLARGEARREAVRDIVHEELPGRLTVSPAAAVENLPRLLRSYRKHYGTAATTDLLSDAVGQVTQGVFGDVVSTLMTGGHWRLIGELLALVSPHQRADAAPWHVAPREELVSVALALGDPYLLSQSLRAPSPKDILDLICVWASAQDERPPLRDLLGAFSEDVVWQCFESLDVPNDSEVVARAADLAESRGVSISQLADDADTVFRRNVFAHVADHSSMERLLETLRARPELAQSLLAPATSTTVREAAILSLSPGVAAQLVDPASLPTYVPYHVASHLSAGFIDSVARGVFEGDVAVRWLRLPIVKRWISRASRLELGVILDTPHFLSRWCTLVANAIEPGGNRALLRPVCVALAELPCSELEPAWNALTALAERTGREDHDLATATIAAVRRCESDQSQRLLEIMFSGTHQALGERRRTVWQSIFGRPSGQGEQWLAQFWRDRGWSRDGLSRCAGDNEPLRERLLGMWSALS